MFSEEKIQKLNQVISSQNEEICKLNKKLEYFDSVVNERNELREIYNKLGECHEKTDTGYKKLFTELLTRFDIQTKTLKKVADAEYECELKNEKLEDVNNCMSQQLQILKCNENKLQLDLADSETTLKCVQKELCEIKLELEEQKSMVKKLETNFKCKEQELYEVSRKLDECETKYNKLNETNDTLNMDLKDVKQILINTKLCAKNMEDKFQLELEHLSNELKTSFKKCNELEMRYDEAKSELNGERCTIKTFTKKIIESNKANAKTHLEAKSRLQKLQDEICLKNNELCCLKTRLNELKQENEFKCTEINSLKNKLSERECDLQQMNLLSEKIKQIEKNDENCCCPKMRTETTNCCSENKTRSNISCKRENFTKDDMCCGKSDNEKTVIQNDVTKPNALNNIHKTILNNLICELVDLQQSIFYTSQNKHIFCSSHSL